MHLKGARSRFKAIYFLVVINRVKAIHIYEYSPNREMYLIKKYTNVFHLKTDHKLFQKMMLCLIAIHIEAITLMNDLIS